ncbi:unnamed protein product [Calypogeia fissa]
MVMARGSSVSRLACVAVVLGLFVISLMATDVQAQAPAPAPLPTSDGHTIDQGIAYFLLLLALVLTYLIPMDAFPSFF